MNYFRRRTRIIAIFSGLVIAGAIIAYVFSGGSGVPGEFSEARSRGALIAQSIVSLSQESTSVLEEINRLDRQGRLSEALALTTNLMEKNDELRNRAIELSREVEAMTLSLESLRDGEAQEVALESIASRLAMVSGLISYSNNFEELLSVLQGKFRGQPVKGARPVNTIINEINSQVEAINNFDQEAQRSIERFDAIIGKNA
ncbi:MAG: hypothetical protein KGZ30_00205 [Anaplasmataceae bacterium]|nr:hypothetical protein [Anaplasmataceae bacterium]